MQMYRRRRQAPTKYSTRRGQDMNEMASESPYDLLISSTHGDIDAYGELFDRYGQKLYNFAYYLTYSREEAQDITSDTFVRVFEALQGREVSSFNLQAYLYKTARNLSLNAIERRKREGLTLEEASEFAQGDIFADPERAALLTEQREKVKDASSELTGDQQAALLLKELEGLPYDTIAEVLNSNPNAVGALLSRARLKFREVYRMTHAQTNEIPDECARITPLLSSYIDDEASPEERKRVESHLASCPICNGNLESMREASVTYRGLIPILPFASLKALSGLKVAMLGGKAAAHLAGAMGAESASTTGVAGAASGGVGATAGAASTTAYAGGMSLLAKVVAVVAGIVVLSGAGVATFFGIRSEPLKAVITSPKSGTVISLEPGLDGTVNVPINIVLNRKASAIEVEVNGAVISTDEGKAISCRYLTDKDGKREIRVFNRVNSKRESLASSVFTLKILGPVAKVVFVRGGNIWVMNPDGSGQAQLTTSGADSVPSVSPDGSLIAFVSSRDGFPSPPPGYMIGDYYSSLPCIYVMSADGSNQRRLTGSELGECESPCFFPDNNRILCHRLANYNSGDDTWMSYLSTVSAKDGSLSNIAEVQEGDFPNSFHGPKVTSDGQEIYWYSYGGDPGHGTIMVTDVASGSEYALINPERPNGPGVLYEYWDPSVSRDGLKLAVAGISYGGQNPSFGHQLMICDSDGGNRKLYSVPDNNGSCFSWVDDKTLLISVSTSAVDQKEPNGIYIKNLDEDSDSKIANGESAIFCRVQRKLVR